MDRNSQNNVLINKLKTRLAYLNFNTISEFLGQFPISYKMHYIIFQKGVNHFEIEHKTC